MARFDVFAFPEREGFLLDVQADLLDGLNTRIVVPMLGMSDAPKPAERLNPVFEIEGKPYVLVTQFFASVPRSQLKKPQINLSIYSDKITDALDMVFQGF